MLGFSVVAPCGLVVNLDTDRLHLHGSMFLRNVVSTESPHGFTTQKTNIDIITAVRNSQISCRYPINLDPRQTDRLEWIKQTI
jgi:hypothetical protein